MAAKTQVCKDTERGTVSEQTNWTREKTNPISKGPPMNLTLGTEKTCTKIRASAHQKQKTLFEQTNPISEKVKCA